MMTSKAREALDNIHHEDPMKCLESYWVLEQFITDVEKIMEKDNKKIAALFKPSSESS